LSGKKVVIFDFDGVLVDSVEVKTEAFAEIYRPYGELVVDQVVGHHRSHGGVSRFEKFWIYHKEFLKVNPTEEEVRKLSESFSSLVVEKVVSSPEIPGALSFLSHCKQLGLDCAINSATPENEVRDIVNRRGWDGIFCCVLGSPCSKSENIKKIIKSRNASPLEVLFFGDADTDLHAAVDNSVDFVGIGPWMVKHYGGGEEFPVYQDYTGLT
jgi:beta-phosphoglucomutase-like phosphatase (HAD superfamily)